MDEGAAWWLVFRKFTEAIRGDDGCGLVKGYLRPIDTDEIARQLEIDAEAAKRGSRGQPSSDLDSLDAIEQKIVQKLESEWTYHGSDLINNLRAYWFVKNSRPILDVENYCPKSGPSAIHVILFDRTDPISVHVISILIAVRRRPGRPAIPHVLDRKVLVNLFHTAHVI